MQITALGVGGRQNVPDLELVLSPWCMLEAMVSHRGETWTLGTWPTGILQWITIITCCGTEDVDRQNYF